MSAVTSDPEAVRLADIGQALENNAAAFLTGSQQTRKSTIQTIRHSGASIRFIAPLPAKAGCCCHTPLLPLPAATRRTKRTSKAFDTRIVKALAPAARNSH